MLLASTAPFYWYREDGTDLKHGTMFFVNTGKKVIAVTASHVYEGYTEDCSKNKITAQILGGNFEFNPKQRLIDRNKKIDIATFDITENELIEIKKCALSDNRKWPPNSPAKNQGAFAIGYPGKARVVDDKKRIIEWGYIHLLCVTKNITSENISLQLEPEYAEPYSDMPMQYDTRGISGAPLLILETDPIFYCRLGGVIYEANNEFGLIFARPANFINDDGCLNQELLT